MVEGRLTGEEKIWLAMLEWRLSLGEKSAMMKMAANKQKREQ